MYLRITSKCSMTCPHCCYSCSPKRGMHMDMFVFEQAWRWALDYDSESIFIGGGEPTIHPRFKDIVRRLCENFNYVWMATNGKKKSMIWWLVEEIGDMYPDVFSMDLSQDPWHEKIDPEVVAFFKRHEAKGYGYGRSGPYYRIRNVSHSVKAQGRTKKTQVGWEDGCVCSDIIIEPDGKIKACGCPSAPVIGDVFRGIEDKYRHIMHSEEYTYEHCWTAYQKEMKLQRRSDDTIQSTEANDFFDTEIQAHVSL